jgi:hypothetical protein
VAHPADLLGRQVGEEGTFHGGEVGLAELGDTGSLDPAAELLRHELHPVADAERRNAELEDAWIDLRRALGVDGGGAAGEDERERVAGRQLRR